MSYLMATQFAFLYSKIFLGFCGAIFGRIFASMKTTSCSAFPRGGGGGGEGGGEGERGRGRGGGRGEGGGMGGGGGGRFDSTHGGVKLVRIRSIILAPLVGFFTTWVRPWPLIMSTSRCCRALRKRCSWTDGTFQSIYGRLKSPIR